MTDESRAVDPRLSTPLQRLQASRERMRTYLLPAERKPREHGADAGLTERIGDKLGEWRHHPLVGAVVDAVEGWWAHHPLRSVADIGSTAARELAGPVLRRHPVACVAGALVVGALLVRVRPWRWVLKPALFAGLTTQVVSRLLSDAPMEFVLNALMKLRPHATADAPTATNETPASAPPASDSAMPAQAMERQQSKDARERLDEPAPEPVVPP